MGLTYTFVSILDDLLINCMRSRDDATQVGRMSSSSPL